MASGQLFAAFCGGSNSERSLSTDAARTVNLFRSTSEHEGAVKKATLLGTPGLRRLGTIFGAGGTGQGRGLFTQAGRTWTVIGDTLYELLGLPSFGAIGYGTIADDGAPVSFAHNGEGDPNTPHPQLVVVGGGELKVLNLTTNVLSAAIILPLTNAPVQVGFLDGYFVLLERDSPRWWFAFEDATVWDALDVVVRSTASDPFVALVVANSRVWLFGCETSEAYEDVGDADSPFQPIKGSLFQIGCAARWSVSIGINTLRWLGRSARGGAMVYRLDGYGGSRISTHAIEAQLRVIPDLLEAEALTYDQEGHLFYALTCGDRTLVWDETENSWHERESWDTTRGQPSAWRVRGHAFVGQTHLVGQRPGGSIASAIYVLDLDAYDEDGEILRALRRAPYLGADNSLVFLDEIELGIESGVGLVSGQGVDPQIQLNLSTDNGKSWTSCGTASCGAMGQTEATAVWRRCGRARLDRLVLEVVVTDPVKRVLGPGLWIRATPGTA